jgi:choline-sulfatase
MLRRGKMKFLYYVGYPAQLYDLARDPEEMRDVSRDPAYRDPVKRMESELRSLVDPEAIDARAKSDQRAIVERNGGREAVVARGMFGYTPAPGETPEYQ